MIGAPTLRRDGAVVFASADDHRAAFGTFLSQGALLVHPDFEPMPFQRLDIRVQGGCLTEEIPLKAEVVASHGGGTLLRLLEFDPHTLERLRPPAAVESTEPPPAGDSSFPGAPPVPPGGNATPGPVAPAAAGARATASPAAGTAAKASSAGGDATSTDADAPVRAPLLEGEDLLRFLSTSDFDGARRELDAVGAVMATCTRIPDLYRDFSLHLSVGPYLHATPLVAACQPAGPGQVVVQFRDRAAVRRESARIDMAVATYRPAIASAPVPSGEASRPAPKREPRPAALAGDVLRFETPEDVLAERAGLGDSGAIAVQAPDQPPLNVRRKIVVRVGSRDIAALDGECVHYTSGYAGIVFFDKAGLTRLLAVCEALVRTAAAAAAAPAPAPPPVAAPPPPSGSAEYVELQLTPGPSAAAAPFRPPESATGGTPGAAGAFSYAAPSASSVAFAGTAGRTAGFTLQRAGTLRNPATVEELLAVEISKPPTPAQLAEPSTVVLLRWLYSLQGVQQVSCDIGKPRPPPFAVVNGLEVRSQVPFELLAKALAEPAGTYEVTELPAAPQPALFRHSGRTRKLLVDVLRNVIRRFGEKQLAAGRADQAALAPKLNDQGRNFIAALGFTASQQRVAWRMLDGNYRIPEVINSGAGPHGSWELLYMLELHGGLMWVEPPAKAGPAAPVNPVEARWRELEKKDHFEVLGIHWSTAPRRIEPAYREVRALYGVGSANHAKSPESCDKILRRAEEAYRILSNSALRHMYRKERYPGVKFAYQAELMLQQAKLVALREDDAAARELIEGVLDFNPTEEAKEELAKLLAPKPRRG